MNATLPKIKALHTAIERNIFHRYPKWDYGKITHAIDLLARLVHAYESPNDDNLEFWAIGEFGYCSLDSLIVAAYWHYSEWHSGQWSPEYATLSALGDVFGPGAGAFQPIRGDSAFDTYKALDAMARRANKMPVYCFCPIALSKG